ncbi:MAG: ABC transporter ATP-binding protein, partial [Pseudomonadota bacterium]
MSNQQHTQPVLTVDDLHLVFDLPEGEFQVLKGIDFQIHHGQTVALVGESGSGKTVVSQAIMGLLPKNARITQGAIMLHDHPDDPGTMQANNPAINLAGLDQDSPQFRAIRGRRVSIIFQEPMTSLSPLHKIGDQITEAICLHRNASRREAHELACTMMGQCGFLAPERQFDQYPFELSGGLRQRAMIAMALVCQPALLIADEPTTALDVTIQAQILKLMRMMQSRLQMAMLLITHDLGVVANMADELVVIYHGELMERGTAEDLFRSPAHPYLQALLDAVPRTGMQPGERLSALREIELPKRRRSPDAWRRLDECNQQIPVLEAQRLYKAYQPRMFAGYTASEFIAVRDVSLQVNRGECLGLVGESGCGKTSFAKMLMGALTPGKGKVLFYNGGQAIDVHKMDQTDQSIFRRKVQFVFQDPFSSLNPRMSVLDILSEPLLVNGIGNRLSRRQHARDLMHLVGLNPDWLSRYPHSFSGGQRQRVGIARALALDPDLIILDEPVSALDVSVQAQILNLLKMLQHELGLSYLFISHNLAVVSYMCNRIAVMCRGQLVELAPESSLFTNTKHPYTKSLLRTIPEPDPDRPMNFAAIG